MNGRVLVVDDDPSVRRIFRRMLEGEGLEVVVEEDGEAGLAAVHRMRPDVVLLDVQLPKLNGFEVCRKIKDDPEFRLTPVVLVTGLSDVQDRIRGLEVGADDFLSKPVERSELQARVRSLLKLKSFTDELERAELVLFTLARSIEARDSFTENHCERLSVYAAELGRRLGLAEKEISALHRGGIVHDIGKITVPDSILLKAAPLTDEERDVMRQHPVTGEHICKPMKTFRLVLPIIRHHHEKLDGSGYPDGLKGDEVPLTARILQVVDVYDALTTDRPYRQALSSAEALNILNEEVGKGWWDPDVVGEFGRLVISGELPPITS